MTTKGADYEEKIHYLMSLFDGRQVEGSLFYCEKPVILPMFESISTRYLLKSGDEIDLIGRNSFLGYWIVEAKCRNKKAGIIQ